MDRADEFFDTALFCFADIDNIDCQLVALRVALVEPKQVCREKRGLVPSGPAPDLHDDVFAVVGIFGDQRRAQLGLKALDSCRQSVDLVSCHDCEIGIVVFSEDFRVR